MNYAEEAVEEMKRRPAVPPCTCGWGSKTVIEVHREDCKQRIWHVNGRKSVEENMVDIIQSAISAACAERDERIRELQDWIRQKSTNQHHVLLHEGTFDHCRMRVCAEARAVLAKEKP